MPGIVYKVQRPAESGGHSLSDAAKKQRNREYYLKNRENILTRATERKNHRRKTHMEIVPSMKTDMAEAASEVKGISETAETFQIDRPACLPGNSDPAAVAEIFQSDSAADDSKTCETNDFVFSQVSPTLNQRAAPTATLPISEFVPGINMKSLKFLSTFSLR